MIWFRKHLWLIAVALLAIGGWVARVESTMAEVASQRGDMRQVSADVRAVQWSLDSLRLEMRHLNRNIEELVRRPE